MFKSIFASKNQKLVRQWIKEHKLIVKLATSIIENYTAHDIEKTRKDLKKLEDVALEHLMMEDIEFYKLLKENEKEKVDAETEKLVKEFTKSFTDTKLVLMKFLVRYTQDDIDLDEDFFETFNAIVAVLAERIKFEEENLYQKLSIK